MTPFLSRLVDRALPSADPALGARPVVPSLFAAGPSVEPADGGDGESAASMDHPAPGAMLSPPPHLPAGETPAPHGDSLLRAATSVEAPKWTGQRDEAARPVSLTATPPAEPHAGTPPPAARTPLGIRPAPAATRQSADLVADGHPHADPVRPAIRTAPVTPRAPAMQTPLAAAAPAAPVVRVTIGRIEVRAVTPPAPTPARAPSPPAKRTAIVLEDYLRGGAR